MKDFGDGKAKTLVFQDTFVVKILQLIAAHTDTWCCGGETCFCENYRSSKNSMGNVKFYFLNSTKYFGVVK